MKTTSILGCVASVLALGVQRGYAECYDGALSPNFIDKDYVHMAAGGACATGSGVFGDYCKPPHMYLGLRTRHEQPLNANSERIVGPGETKSFCLNDNNAKTYFELTNMNHNQGFTLKQEDCENTLLGLIDPCDKGGDIEVAAWRYE